MTRPPSIRQLFGNHRVPEPIADVMEAGPNSKQPPRRNRRIENFWSRFQSQDAPYPDMLPCRVWMGAVDRYGYGVYRWPDIEGKARPTSTHKIAFALHSGIDVWDIYEGLEVMHACDNPRCGEDSHLSLGTRSDNMRDAKRKGRKYSGKD